MRWDTDANYLNKRKLSCVSSVKSVDEIAGIRNEVSGNVAYWLFLIKSWDAIQRQVPSIYSLFRRIKEKMFIKIIIVCNY